MVNCKPAQIKGRQYVDCKNKRENQHTGLYFENFRIGFL